MAISRNARRQASKLRATRAANDAANTAMVMKRNDIVRRNLSSSPKRETSRGLVAGIYQMGRAK